MSRTVSLQRMRAPGLCALLLLAACGGGTEGDLASDSEAASACVSTAGGPCGGNTATACSCGPGLTCVGTGGLPVGDVGGTCQPALCGARRCAPGQTCCSVPDATGVCSPRCITGSFCPAMPCRAPPPPNCGASACAPGQRCCSIPDATGVCSPRCIASPFCPAMPCRAPPPDGGTCVQNVLCVVGSHWDQTLCKCVADAPDGGSCVDNVLCVVGSHWDRTVCKCVPDAPNGCTTAADCSGILPALCVPCGGGGYGCAHWACVAGQCQAAYCN